MADKIKFSKILLKVSGEALMGSQGFGIDPDMVNQICADIRDARNMGCVMGIVVGGGNIFRGVAVAAKGGNRVTGDHMGMLATIMNALALCDALKRHDVPAIVLSAVPVGNICETFSQKRLDAAMVEGKVVIFAGGTGNPYFTTDTGAALRASEMGAQALFKATQVDGVYSADPQKVPDAKRYDEISHDELLEKGLAVMDVAAVALARENNIPVVVFSIHNPGGLGEILAGKGRYTLVTN